MNIQSKDFCVPGFLQKANKDGSPCSVLEEQNYQTEESSQKYTNRRRFCCKGTRHRPTVWKCSTLNAGSFPAFREKQTKDLRWQWPALKIQGWIQTVKSWASKFFSVMKHLPIILAQQFHKSNFLLKYFTPYAKKSQWPKSKSRDDEED